jgi:hypothetical protein
MGALPRSARSRDPRRGSTHRPRVPGKRPRSSPGPHSRRPATRDRYAQAADEGERRCAEGGQVEVVPEHPDDFEVALRTWSAQEEIIEEACAITEILGLDPALVDQMHTACRGDGAGVAMREAACDLLVHGQVLLAHRWGREVALRLPTPSVGRRPPLCLLPLSWHPHRHEDGFCMRVLDSSWIHQARPGTTPQRLMKVSRQLFTSPTRRAVP